MRVNIESGETVDQGDNRRAMRLTKTSSSNHEAREPGGGHYNYITGAERVYGVGSTNAASSLALQLPL